MKCRCGSQCSWISYRGKTYSLSPPNPFACSMPFRNRRLIMGASVPYRVVLFGRLWLNKREAASVPYELVIATTNKRLYRQSRRRTMALSPLLWYISVPQWTLIRRTMALSTKAPLQRTRALLTKDRRTMALSTFLGTFSSPYLTKFRVDYVSWMPLDPSFGFIFQSSLALEKVLHTESLHLRSISLGVSQFTVGVSLSEYHSRSISLGVSHWRIYELRWILLQSQRTNIRLCLT